MEQLALKALRWAVCLVFVFSGVAKLVRPDAFLASLQAYQLAPTWLEISLVWFLPALELTCALALISRWWIGGALLLLQTLLIVFTLALGLAWWRGLNIECGCFGAWLDFGSYGVWITRNLLLWLACFILGRKKFNR
jgi:hypothetical protein